MATDTKTVIANSSDWRSATRDLIDHLIGAGESFSSGEIVREIRTHRPDLRFSATNLGEYVRDLFYSGGMPDYVDGYGDNVYPTQVPRTTQGIGRTPAGIQVFVYCADHADGFVHNFEVDIPDPRAPSPSPTPPTPVAPTPVAPTPVVIKGKPIDGLVATVHVDRRLCIPRSAFEAYVHATGKPMRGGQVVYIKVDVDKVTLSLDDPGKGIPYNLAATRGRVLFPSQGSPFRPNDRYRIVVDQDGLTVDLSASI